MGIPCILVGYFTQSKGYRVYNKRTRLIVETIHLRFDEIKEMSETSVANDTSGLLDLLFVPLYDEFFNDGTSRVNKSSSPTDNSTQQDTPPTMNIHPTSEPSTPTNVYAEENNNNQAEYTNPFCTPVQEVVESSSCNIGNSNVHTFNQPQYSEYRWIKDHPLTQVRGDPSTSANIDRQLAPILKCEDFICLTYYKSGNSFHLNLLQERNQAKLYCNSSAKAEYGVICKLCSSNVDEDTTLRLWLQLQQNTIVLRLSVSHSNLMQPRAALPYQAHPYSFEGRSGNEKQEHGKYNTSVVEVPTFEQETVQGDSLNLPDHRIIKDGEVNAYFHARVEFITTCSCSNYKDIL
ncbi:hypothetical protein Tco_0855806 [Tanacetum coccineum]